MLVTEFQVPRQAVGQPTVEPARLYAELIRFKRLNFAIGFRARLLATEEALAKSRKEAVAKIDSGYHAEFPEFLA